MWCVGGVGVVVLVVCYTPDAPVSKFTMNLFGGAKRGLLVNSKPLCKTSRLAKVTYNAQNGIVLSGDLKIATSCGGKKTK